MEYLDEGSRPGGRSSEAHDQGATRADVGDVDVDHATPGLAGVDHQAEGVDPTFPAVLHLENHTGWRRGDQPVGKLLLVGVAGGSQCPELDLTRRDREFAEVGV